MPNITPYLNKIKSAIYGEEVRGSIHDAIQAINNEVDASDQVNLKNAIAPNYSSNTSTTYDVGDYVFYPDGTGRLYMCQTPTTGGIEFLSSNWRQVPITELLSKYVEVNQFRFDSTSGSPVILEGKSCNELVVPNVWYVNYVRGVSMLVDFPIDGPGWIRITATASRIIQQVYPSDPAKFPYRLYRTRDDRSGTISWSDWYKIPFYGTGNSTTSPLENLDEALFYNQLSDPDSMADGMFLLYSGGIHPTAGTNTSSEARCRTAFIKCEEPLKVVFDNKNYLVRIWGYSIYGSAASGTKAYATDQNISSYVVVPTNETKYMRASFYKADGSDMTTDTTSSSSDWYKIQHDLRIYKFSGGHNMNVEGTKLVFY